MSGGGNLSVSAEGWDRFDEVCRTQAQPENPVFVAMWFGGKDKRAEMGRLYEQGILSAIRDAGYRGERVDDVEHNEWIMDAVLGMIRVAPFVVADFTGHRNGVYLEAGFARGLGIPVINCCRASELDDSHFDTKQLNHVLWSNPEEMRKRLYNRIMGSIGPGPFPPERRDGPQDSQ